MSPLTRNLLIGLGLGIVVVIAMGIYADTNELANSFLSFRWGLLAPVLALTLLSYVLRYGKWHYYLRLLDVRVPHKDSALVFFTGLSMAITPGKFGELYKAVLLRERADVRETETASVVVAERLTDFIALIVLAAIGVVVSQDGIFELTISVFGTALCLILFSSRRATNFCIGVLERFPLGRRIAPKLRQMFDSIAALIQIKPLILMTLLSVVAWFCECVGFYWILCGLPGTQPDLGTATFVYSLATIGGALAMLPGGLGATEFILIKFSQKFFLAPGALVATAGAMLIRFCTLWFAVIVGLVGFILHRLIRPVGVGKPTKSSVDQVSVDTPEDPERKSASNT